MNKVFEEPYPYNADEPKVFSPEYLRHTNKKKN